MNDLRNETAPVIVVGIGVAGLTAALSVSHEIPVVLIGKTAYDQSNSFRAQGGVAAAVAQADRTEYHIKDTLTVGRGLGNRERVRILAEEGAHVVRPYFGNVFVTDGDGTPLLGREAGHSFARILHARGGITGQVLLAHLWESVQQRENISIVRGRVTKLWTESAACFGVVIENKAGMLQTLSGRATILATGGYAGLFRSTTNPEYTTGDGLMLAYDAGAVLQDLEFIQFHPTVLDDGSPRGSALLLSEALRGLGAQLYDADGFRIMTGHPQLELAPRDEVSRAVHLAKMQTGKVFLRMTHLSPERIDQTFHHLAALLADRGWDLKRDNIPIRPGAHFTMGGVVTDDQGKTAVSRLYAVGEAASMGLHGANRLASNSLLEGLVFGQRAALSASQEPALDVVTESISVNHLPESPMPEHFAHSLDDLLGVVRDESGLGDLWQTLQESPSPAARLMAMATQSALMRKESRGAHWRRDYPASSAQGVGHWQHQRESRTLVFVRAAMH